MPFSTTTNVPSPNSLVTVKFTGLMLLKAGPNNTCEVGVHRFSAFHAFQAMLVVDKPNRPLTFIRLTSGPLTGPMSIEIPNPGAGFQAFSQEPFGRNDPNSHEFDHRWALNMREFHPNADFNDGARPVVTLNSGILYASNLTRGNLNPQLVPATASTTPAQPLHRFAADLAVAIDVPANDSLTFRWTELGEVRKPLELPRATDPTGTTYTILLMNEPPTSHPLPHDELALYYKVLHDQGNRIADAQQLRIQVPPARSDEIPCMPITLNP